MKKNKKTIKRPIRGIVVNGLNVSIFDSEEEYEVHVTLNVKKDIDENLDRVVEYLGSEGYFDVEKPIKVIGITFNKKGSMDNGFFFSDND